MKGWFDDLGFPLPEVSIKTGFPSAGKRSPNISDSWTINDGNAHVILIRPDNDQAEDVAAAIAFQMCHIATGDRDAHGHLFRHLAISIGLRGTKTESRPGTLFKEMIKPTLRRLGKLPSSGISPVESVKKTTQSTRLLKVSCPECGYVARVSRKWLDEVGPPHCPKHGPMLVHN